MTTSFSAWQERLWQVPGLNQQVVTFLVYSLIFHIGLLGITDVLLNFYFVSIGYDADTISVLQGLPRLSGFLTGLPIGLIANRFGKRRIIIWSSYGVAFCIAATVLAPSLFLLALSRFLWGFFFGAGQIVKPPYLVTLTYQDEHTAQFSYHNLISMIGVSAGSVIGGTVPLLMVGLLSIPASGAIPPEQTPLAYQSAILFAAGLVALSVLPLYRLPADTLSKEKETQTPNKQKRFETSRQWGQLIKLSSPLLIFGISGGLTFPFFNLFFREQFNVADNAVGTIIALGWFAMGLIPLLNPFWEKRLGRANALVILMLISAIAFWGLGISQVLLFAIPLYMLGIGIRNTMQPLFQPLLMASLPSELHNLASSVGLILWNIGWFGATMSFGWLQAMVGFDGIMIVVAVFVLLNGLCIALVFGKNPR